MLHPMSLREVILAPEATSPSSELLLPLGHVARYPGLIPQEVLIPVALVLVQIKSLPGHWGNRTNKEVPGSLHPYSQQVWSRLLAMPVPSLWTWQSCAQPLQCGRLLRKPAQASCPQDWPLPHLCPGQVSSPGGSHTYLNWIFSLGF